MGNSEKLVGKSKSVISHYLTIKRRKYKEKII